MTKCLAAVCVALLGNAVSIPALAQPANDACANAITLVSGVATPAPISSTATRDGPSSISCGTSPPPVFNDIWYRVVPVRGPSGMLTVTSTSFPNQWRFVEVFSAAGGCGVLGAPVACDATTTPTSAQFTLPATASGYLVRVGLGSPYIAGFGIAFTLTYTDPPVAALPTAFTYQGRLKNAGAPVNTPTDMTFRLWDAPVLGVQIGPTVVRSGVNVTEGLFTTPLDFGATPFGGQDRWLEIAVGPGAGTVLSPRQQLTPTPYSLYSLSAGQASHADTATFATSAGNAGAGAVSVTNRIVSNLSTRTYTGVFQPVPESVQTLTLPAGTAVITWSMSGYFEQGFATARIRPSIGGVAAPAMTWGANATGTSTFISYFHTFISGSYSVHIPGGTTTVQLEAQAVGTLRTDTDDSLSWTLVVHKD